MSPFLTLFIISGYFVVLLFVSWLTSRKADSDAFFTGNRNSPWYLVAFGMIGASLSGVTFISVPGWVGTAQFSYFQMVLGYLVGYFVIGSVLMPLYYKLNLVSIYTYLEGRFGKRTYQTGSFFFLLSRVIGASFRLFLVAGVLQISVFHSWGVPFWVSVLVTVILIWLYTFKGGIKTIVWTDALQTFFMLVAVGVTIYLIKDSLSLSWGSMITKIQDSSYSKIFFWDWNSKYFFLKQFLGGALIAIVMTGLDQDMMQKNLTCRSLGDAQKNMFWFSVVLIFVNLFFLALGALLYLYANQQGIAIPERTDYLYPIITTQHMSTLAGIIFLLGITAAAYSSADSALTSLTTSFCIDFLDFKKMDKRKQQKVRMRVHVVFSILIFVIILIFEAINKKSVIEAIFEAAGYTYGPLLGLFAYGLLTSRQLHDRLVPIVCVVSPVITFVLKWQLSVWLQGIYSISFAEVLLINGLLTFVGLLLIGSSSAKDNKSVV